MNILIDINHPAQVHYFRNLYHLLKGKHTVIVTSKEVPIQIRLLKAYDIPYVSYGKKSDSLSGKLFRQVRYNIECHKLIREHNIDVTLGSSASNIYAAKFSKAVSIATTDSDLAVLPLSAKFMYPFADYLMTPDSLAFQKYKNQICYPGYQELAYLHPKRFTPDVSVLAECGLDETDKFFILRFTAFKAHHDIGMYGLSTEQKWELIKLLEQHGKVIITSENQEPQFNKYYLRTDPEKIHSLMYYATMLVCDSQTMTTEAAVLGTPAMRCNTFACKLTVIEEIEKKYELAYSFQPRQYKWMITRICSILSSGDVKSEWKNRRARMLADKIDVTSFWLWLIDNHPESENKVIKGKVNFDEFR